MRYKGRVGFPAERDVTHLKHTCYSSWVIIRLTQATGKYE
jgi:hypothetical protein